MRAGLGDCGPLPSPARNPRLPAANLSTCWEEIGGSAWESNPASPVNGERPILKTGRATGPRSLPGTTVTAFLDLSNPQLRANPQSNPKWVCGSELRNSIRNPHSEIRNDAEDLRRVAEVLQYCVRAGCLKLLDRVAPRRRG